MTNHKITNADIKGWAKNYNGPLFDGILCDPPYELGFMGKSWDSSGIAFDTDMWADLFKLVKPGGHLLAFSGSRTYHRMAVAIEDAGFEIRDMIEWVYGSGFPKSLNIGKSVNQLETNEWTKISKALDNIQKTDIIRVWKSNSNNVNIVAKLSQKQATVVGKHTDLNDSVLFRVVLPTSQEKLSISADTVEIALSVHQATPTRINTVLQNVVAEIKQLQEPVKFAEKSLQSQNHKHLTTSTAQENVKDTPSENMANKIRVEEALKTLRGKRKYSDEETINVLCAVLTENLLHTILNQSKTFQSLDTTSKTECASVITVTITEYMAECLTTYTVDIAKSKAVDKIQGNEREVIGTRKVPDQRGGGINSQRTAEVGVPTRLTQDTKGTSEWEGYGTALKPAHEPCVLARKPIEGTVANNVLTHGTGGLNIDGTRIPLNGVPKTKGGMTGNKSGRVGYMVVTDNGFKSKVDDSVGRFPANLIHDGSDEVVGLFPETSKSVKRPPTTGEKPGSVYGKYTDSGYERGYTDNGGSAARFFYCAKSSRSERNLGLDGTVSIVVQLEQCENNITKEVKLAQLQVVMDSSHLKATAESGIGTKSGTEWSMSLFGNPYTEKYLTSTKSTTKTETSSITPSIILNYLTGLLTSENTLGANCEMTVGGSPAESVENSNTLTLTINEKTASALGVENAQSPLLLKISVNEGRNFHSTVKPLSLTKYLANLIKPPTGGRLLVPFSGSGSEMIGALQAGWEYVEGVELTEEYIPIAEARIKHWTEQTDKQVKLI